MLTKHSRYIKIFVIIAVFVCIGGTYLLFTRHSNMVVTSGGRVDTSSWLTYTNQTYSFSLTYPPSWKVAEGGTDSVPLITLYKIDQDFSAVGSVPPYSHFVNATYVSVYPHGIPTEGLVAERESASVLLQPQTSKANDLLLQNGDVFAREYIFKKPPISWDLWGFVWARSTVSDYSMSCQENGQLVADSECGLGGKGVMVRKGTISVTDRVTEEAILQTFHFIK